MIYFQLFLTFFKIGALTFGGGYAMIPLIQDEVLSWGWMNLEQIINFIAVCESTPGPIAVNMATFVGYSQGGVFGAVCATLGVVLPSFIIILLIVSLIHNLLKFAGVKAFLNSLKPVVVGLILGTAITVFMQVIFAFTNIKESVISFDYKAITIFALIVIFNFVYKKITKKTVSAILLIILSAILGIIFYGLLP